MQSAVSRSQTCFKVDGFFSFLELFFNLTVSLNLESQSEKFQMRIEFFFILLSVKRGRRLEFILDCLSISLLHSPNSKRKLSLS